MLNVDFDFQFSDMVLNMNMFSIYINTMVILSIMLGPTICDDLCVTCQCDVPVAYCIGKVLKPPLTGAPNVLKLYILRSNVTLVFNVELRLPSLRELYVVDSLLTSANEEALTLLRNLQTLEFTRVEIADLEPRIFFANTMLQYIYLSNNNINELHSDVFSKLPNLTVLKLNMNKLHTIYEGTFTSNSKLETLDIASNHLLSLKPGIFNISDVTDFTLNKSVSINISNNELVTIEPYTFALCSHITVLDLSHNRISQLYSDVFVGLSSLRKLLLNSNSLSENIAGVYFRLTSLQILDLRENQITSIPCDTFKGLSLLSELHLSQNQIKSLDSHAFRGLSSLRLLALGGNALKDVGDAFGAEAGAGLAALTELQAWGNRLWHLPPGAFAGCPALLALDLSDNALSRLEDGAFHGCARLRTLRLRDNALQRLPPRAFAGLVHLRELHLGGNFLSALYLAPFAPLEQLQRLTVQLEAGSPCDCALFARLKRRNVHLHIEESSSLTERCARFYQLYLDSNCTTIDCPEVPPSRESEARGKTGEPLVLTRESLRKETTSGCVDCARSIGTMETASLEPTIDSVSLCGSNNCSNTESETGQILPVEATSESTRDDSNARLHSPAFSVNERDQSVLNVTTEPSEFSSAILCDSCNQTHQGVMDTSTTNTSLQAKTEHAGNPVTMATVVYSLLGGSSIVVVCATLLCFLKRLKRFCLHQDVGGRNYEEVAESHVYEEIDGEQSESTRLPQEMEDYSMSDHRGVRTSRNASSVYEVFSTVPPPLPCRRKLVETEVAV